MNRPGFPGQMGMPGGNGFMQDVEQGSQQTFGVRDHPLPHLLNPQQCRSMVLFSSFLFLSWARP